MSSVKTQSRYDGSRHLNFITTAAWQLFFKTYTFNQPSQANNFTGSGALSAVLNTSGAAVTASDCPVGRILRTNGKKLYPDAAGLDLTAYPDRTPLVGVFDYHSGLSGFIDPNATVFAIYNVDKPIDSLDGTAASGANNHKGMSVFTGGTVTAVGNVKTQQQLVLGSGTTLVNVYSSGTAGAKQYDFGQTGAVFVGSSATTTLTVASVSSGTITVGSVFVYGGTSYTITALISGTGGAGTYALSGSPALPAGTTVTIPNQTLAFYSFVVGNNSVVGVQRVPPSGTLLSVLYAASGSFTIYFPTITIFSITGLANGASALTGATVPFGAAYAAGAQFQYPDATTGNLTTYTLSGATLATAGISPNFAGTTISAATLVAVYSNTTIANSFVSTPLAFSATATQGSTSLTVVTPAVSTTIAVGQVYYSAGVNYTIVAGSGAAWTISPAFVPASATAYFYSIPSIFSTGTISVTATSSIVVNYVSNGTSLVELSRSAGLTSIPSTFIAAS